MIENVTMSNRCRVELVGYFYTLELYDSEGAEIYNLDDAAEAAELQYGADWACVYNGNEGVDRDSWLSR
jgi:hypothetical protein